MRGKLVFGIGVLWLAVLSVAAGPPAGRCPPALPTLPKDTLPETIDLVTIPLGLPPARPVPDDNPLTAERVRLGRRLFFDPVLSSDRSVACASCHVPAHGFASRHPVAVGIGGQRGRRNAPSLFNVAYGRSFFWDGRVNSLEEQVLQPIADERELGSDLPTLLDRLRSDPSYVAQFREAFNEGISAETLAKAIAGFERTLLLGNSAVDRFRAGDASALTAGQRQGLWLFESRGRCWQCHSGPNFTDGRFHNTGVSWGGKTLRVESPESRAGRSDDDELDSPDAATSPTDWGRFAVTGRDKDRGAFKTPTLRGVSRTAPYMHDGSLQTLEEVVQFYNRGGTANPDLDERIRPLHLSEEDVRHLVAFLKALTGSPVWERSP